MILKSFQNKANRDRAAKELKAQGYQVRISRHVNQLMHPRYIEDYEYPEYAQENSGFGNTIYKTLFSVVYHLEAKPK